LAFLLLFITAGLVPKVTKAETAQSMRGRFSTYYNARSSQDSHDQNARFTLGLTSGDPGRSTTSGYFLGELFMDFTEESDDEYVFTTTRDKKTQPRLYYAYLDFNNQGFISLGRVGRQSVFNSPISLHFDGGLIETKAPSNTLKFYTGFYGGKPVRDIYNSSEKNDSEVWGTYVKARLFTGNLVQVHYTNLRDYSLPEKQEDDYIGFYLRQEFRKYYQFNINYTQVNGKNKDWGTSISAYYPEYDFMIMLSYYELLKAEEVLPFEFDKYYSTVFSYSPYQRGSVIVHQGIGEHLFFDYGYDFRDLEENEEETTFNHEFDHYFGTVTLAGLLADGLSFSVTSDAYETPSDENIKSYGGNINYKFNDKLTASSGTCYSQYKYDFVFDDEKEKVRTDYAKIKFLPTNKAWRLGLDYSREYTDENDFSSFRANFVIFLK
jgi:hypothetical protein